VVDRRLGSLHPRHPDIRYGLNYGYVPGTLAPDGEPLDAYLLGPGGPVGTARGIVVAVIRREDDIEDKLVVATDGITRTATEIAAAVHFQERYFDSHVETAP
jgi:inorganic pyrophosphatase